MQNSYKLVTKETKLNKEYLNVCYHGYQTRTNSYWMVIMETKLNKGALKSTG